MIPVPTGIIAAPKNKKVQSKTFKYIKSNKNPIGKAKTKETNPKATHNLIAFTVFFPLYPPYLSAKIPPTITPDNGAVTLISENTIINIMVNSKYTYHIFCHPKLNTCYYKIF